MVTVGLELLKDNKWHCMRRGNNNHFTISPGEVKFPIKVRVTSIFNEQLEATIASLENDVDIPSKIQYKGVIAGLYLVSLSSLCVKNDCKLNPVGFGLPAGLCINILFIYYFITVVFL